MKNRISPLIVFFCLLMIVFLCCFYWIRSEKPVVVSVPVTVTQTPTQTEASTAAPYSINLNNADVDHLMTIPGMKRSIAEAIVSDREKNGCFFTVEELLRVPGIGEKTLETMSEYVYTGEMP